MKTEHENGLLFYPRIQPERVAQAPPEELEYPLSASPIWTSSSSSSSSSLLLLLSSISILLKGPFLLEEVEEEEEEEEDPRP